MFIPVGGIFIFGSNDTRGGAIANLVIGLINLVIGGIMMIFGVGQGILFLTIVGAVVVGSGLLMTIFSILALGRKEFHTNEPATDQPAKDLQNSG